MRNAFICAGIRTPIGRYGGALARVRPDDLGAVVIRAVLEQTPDVDPAMIDDVIFGCANQSGEDNRNIARMSLLLAGLPSSISGTTVNRLCGSSLDATLIAARAIQCGESDLILVGGVESMTRAPFVMGKSPAAFARSLKFEDTTMGWRFINPRLEELYGVDAMPMTAENVAEDFDISREDQDRFALRSQQRAAAARASGILAEEIAPVCVTDETKRTVIFSEDEHPRPQTTLEALSALRPVTKSNGTVTAGNSSGINDGAVALLLASEEAIKKFGLKPLTRVVAGATAGVEPRIMGMGPVPATRKLLARTGLVLGQIDLIELNEAFAAQSLAVLRELSLADDAPHVNPNGGAIALGHPLGASGGRLALTATRQLMRTAGRYALCTMCIGVGQGISVLLERA
jgi:acetyl-CoA acyltransferase